MDDGVKGVFRLPVYGYVSENIELAISEFLKSRPYFLIMLSGR